MNLNETLLFVSLAVGVAGCRQTAPPIGEPPVAPPKTEISGTLTGWAGGAAFVTMAGRLSVTVVGGSEGSGLEDLNLYPPLYQGTITISSAGTFSVELSEPAPATLAPLGCTADDPNVVSVSFAVASNAATPPTGDEALGIYVNADSKRLARQGLWLYSAAAYEAKATCTAQAQMALTSIDVALKKGWNQVVGTSSDAGIILTSQPIPESFVWLEPFLRKE